MNNTSADNKPLKPFNAASTQSVVISFHKSLGHSIKSLVSPSQSAVFIREYPISRDLYLCDGCAGDDAMAFDTMIGSSSHFLIVAQRAVASESAFEYQSKLVGFEH